MATIRIEESFELDAPPERVWSYLVDPERIVVCLPGASLDEVVDERTYGGRVTVAVGPVSVTYEGRIEFEEMDEEAYRIRMVGKGREKSGSGSARMTMRSSIEALDSGGSRVTVASEAEVAGKIVRFGRGMIERVGKEIFQDFMGCLEELVSSSEGDEGADEDGENPDAPGRTSPSEDRGEGEEAPGNRSASAASDTRTGGSSGSGSRAASSPARGLTYFFRALRGALADLFRKLTGRG